MGRQQRSGGSGGSGTTSGQVTAPAGEAVALAAAALAAAAVAAVHLGTSARLNHHSLQFPTPRIRAGTYYAPGDMPRAATTSSGSSLRSFPTTSSLHPFTSSCSPTTRTTTCCGPPPWKSFPRSRSYCTCTRCTTSRCATSYRQARRGLCVCAATLRGSVLHMHPLHDEQMRSFIGAGLGKHSVLASRVHRCACVLPWLVPCRGSLRVVAPRPAVVAHPSLLPPPYFTVNLAARGW